MPSPIESVFRGDVHGATLIGFAVRWFAARLAIYLTAAAVGFVLFVLFAAGYAFLWPPAPNHNPVAAPTSLEMPAPMQTPADTPEMPVSRPDELLAGDPQLIKLPFADLKAYASNNQPVGSVDGITVDPKTKAELVVLRLSDAQGRVIVVPSKAVDLVWRAADGSTQVQSFLGLAAIKEIYETRASAQANRPERAVVRLSPTELQRAPAFIK